MTTIKLDFEISEKALAIIDELRADRTRDQLLRQVMELGLCELFERVTAMHRDYVTHTIAGETKDYRQGRAALFGVDAPPKAQPPEKPITDRPDPNPVHVPRGTRV